MPRVAVKVAYDGQGFHGSARQPGLATAEGEILRALRRARIVSDVDAARFQIASRTDRGVSALGNAIAFNTSLDPVAAVRALNAKLSRVWAWAALQVPPDFNPHRARERWYRYDLSRNHDIEKLQSVLSLFQGQHDFRNFTRDRTRTVLRIDQARAIRDGDSVALDFRAPSFRWNLVRRLVSAAVRVDSDVVSLRQVASALEGASRSDLGLAPPEGLTLMDVFFDLEFQRVTDPTTRDRVRQLRIGRLRSLRFVEAVAGRLEGSHLSQDVQGTSP